MNHKCEKKKSIATDVWRTIKILEKMENATFGKTVENDRK